MLHHIIHTYMHTHCIPINTHKWHIHTNIHKHRSHATPPPPTSPYNHTPHLCYTIHSYHTQTYTHTSHTSIHIIKKMIRIQISKTYHFKVFDNGNYVLITVHIGILPKIEKVGVREGNKRKQEATRKDSSLEHRQVLPAGYTLAGVIESEAYCYPWSSPNTASVRQHSFIYVISLQALWKSKPCHPYSFFWEPTLA